MLVLIASSNSKENYQYFYHPDHLGSSSYITTTDGSVSQHVEYLPYGELFLEERNNKWNTSYLFNAKELDEETGLYYYGARYYDSRTSVWLSVDPLAELYPNLGSYVYCFDNPIVLIDPDGKDPEKSRIKYDGNGRWSINLNNLNTATIQNYKQKARDMNNWTYNEQTGQNDIGISTQVGNVDFGFTSQVANINYDAVGIESEHTTIKTQGTKTTKSGQLDKREGRTMSTLGSSKGGAIFLFALDAAFVALDYWTLFSINNDNNVIKQQQTNLQNSADLVYKYYKIWGSKLIPKKYQNANSVGAIINYVFQGQNNTGDKMISGIGNWILQQEGRYDNKTKKIKPLINDETK